MTSCTAVASNGVLCDRQPPHRGSAHEGDLIAHGTRLRYYWLGTGVLTARIARRREQWGEEE